MAKQHGPKRQSRCRLLGGGLAALCTSCYACWCVGSRAEFEHTPAQFGVALLAIAVTTAWGFAESDNCQSLEDIESQSPNELLATLRSATEFACILFVAYACDRTTIFAKASKVQDPASFWAVWLVICVLALFTVTRISKPRILAREQTEEWKGWMQLQFLMYHYFVQVDLYNAIRVYIAAYVWMTGYGNFLYYKKTGNFGAVRVAQTLFRLNFLVALICPLLRNEYMLYYICPMHTLFTLFVWLAVRFSTTWKCLVPTLLCTYVIYDTPLFKFAFWPLKPLLAFHDPLHDFPEMHEWHFRSGLDRYVWIWGMACASALPFVEAVEDGPRKLVARLVAVLAAAPVVFFWVRDVYSRDKFSYNTLHPYTSWIPVTVYIILRNLSSRLRSVYLGLFAGLGKITLETYILQFHVWMKTTGLNGSPKHRLNIIPFAPTGQDADQPDTLFWTNFIIVTALYLYLSQRAFSLTTHLKDALVPTEAHRLKYALAKTTLVVIFFYAAGHLAHLAAHSRAASGSDTRALSNPNAK